MLNREQIVNFSFQKTTTTYKPSLLQIYRFETERDRTYFFK